MTRTQAIQKARRLARSTGTTRYVVYDMSDPDAYDRDHAYFVTTDEGLDTWYAGTHDNDIIYCTADDPDGYPDIPDDEPPAPAQAQQPMMFPTGADLPLFSGTAQRAQAEAFSPPEQAGVQLSMFDTRPQFGKSPRCGRKS